MKKDISIGKHKSGVREKKRNRKSYFKMYIDRRNKKINREE